MSKISQEAASSFVGGRSWRSGNTEVSVGTNWETMLLHGNTIAIRNATGFHVTTAGWNTTTTFSRLNELPGIEVHRKNGKLILNGKEWDGEWKKIE